MQVFVMINVEIMIDTDNDRSFDYVNINSVYPLYLIFNKVGGYIEKINETKYLIFSPTNENKEILAKYSELWDGIKNLIEKINGKLGE